MPSAHTTAGFRRMVSTRTSETSARASAAAISPPLAAHVSSLAPGPQLGVVDPKHVALMRDAAEVEDRETRPKADLQDAVVRPHL